MVKKFLSTLLVSSLLLTPSFAVENNKSVNPSPLGEGAIVKHF
jgi:hypothetical protein